MGTLKAEDQIKEALGIIRRIERASVQYQENDRDLNVVEFVKARRRYDQIFGNPAVMRKFFERMLWQESEIERWKEGYMRLRGENQKLREELECITNRLDEEW